MSSLRSIRFWSVLLTTGAWLHSTASAQGLELFLEENATYHYVNATSATSIGAVPEDWFARDFDDSSWSVGQGAFGSSFDSNLSNASGPQTPNAAEFPGSTSWSVNYDPYLRTSFELPSAQDLTLWIAVDNGVESIYLNGILTGVSFNAEGAARRWEHVIDIPANFVQSGENVIALQLEDHGVATAFAMVITVDDDANNPTFGEQPGTPYCFGLSCPCGNDYGAGGCANSTGVGAILSAAGTTSVNSDDVVLILDQLPLDSFGLIFMGGGMELSTFGDGLRCVAQGPVSGDWLGFYRFPVRNAGSTGKIFEGPGIVAESLGSALSPILAGSTWNFQGYYRDPAGPCGSAFNLSNALTVSFQ